jgi:hypothetical protein
LLQEVCGAFLVEYGKAGEGLMKSDVCQRW